jgi:hypothetical protein
MNEVEEVKNKVAKVKKSKLHKRIKKDYAEASKLEIWQGTRDNFIFGFLGATLIVFISTRADIAVLLGYIAHYFFMGRIVNRPKYITELGQLIIFPLPSAIGAFTGYKISELLMEFIKLHT